jgi:hypothetical protein
MKRNNAENPVNLCSTNLWTGSFLSHTFNIIVITLIDTWLFRPVKLSIVNRLGNKQTTNNSIMKIESIRET